MPDHQRDKLIALAEKQGVVAYQQRADALPRKNCEGAFDFAWGASTSAQ